MRDHESDQWTRKGFGAAVLTLLAGIVTGWPKSSSAQECPPVDPADDGSKHHAHPHPHPHPSGQHHHHPHQHPHDFDNNGQRSHHHRVSDYSNFV